MSTEQEYVANEVSTKLSKEEEAELNKLANEVVETKVNEKGLTQVSNLNGRMRNDNPRIMTLLHTKVWAGAFTFGPPANFLPSSNRTFDMTNKAPAGCKGAVVYVGRNGKNTQDCGWLFAWLSASVGNQWKVYAECGPRSRFTNVNWPVIERQLDRATNSITVTDSATGTRVFAQITGVIGTTITTAFFN